MLGQVIDRYRLVERLGTGWFGTVFKGHEALLDQYRAIKVLSPQVTRTPELVEALFRKSKQIATLRHPHIAQLEHVGQQEGFYYLVTDYFPGGSLRQIIDSEGHLNGIRAVTIFRQVCEALAAAHQVGVAHGSLKPANILVGEHDFVVLTDFGCLPGNRQQVTESSTVDTDPESVAYLSPEQLLGEEASPSSDLYALGVVLFEAMTGELPFFARSRENLSRQQLGQPPPSPRLYNPGISIALEQVILKALGTKPGSRFESADQLARALSAALQPAAAGDFRASPSDDLDLSRPEAAKWTPSSSQRRAILDSPASSGPKPGVVREKSMSIQPRSRSTDEAWDTVLGRLLDLRAWLSHRVAALFRSVPRKRFSDRRLALGAIAGILGAILMVLQLQRLGTAGANGRFTAEKAVDPRSGREFGMVRFNGVPMFIITEPVAESSPVRRAEFSARRLERLASPRGGGLTPDQLNVVLSGTGELLLARRTDPAAVGDPKPEDVVVTVDESTAAAYAGTNRTSLALWWRDLLRDQISLARGQEPIATADTDYGRIMRRVRHQVSLKRRGGWVPAAEIRRAVAALSPSQRQQVNEAWRTVPAAWRGGASHASSQDTAPTLIRPTSVVASDALPGTTAAAVIDGQTSTVWQSRQGAKYRGQRHWLKMGLDHEFHLMKMEVREGSRGNPRQLLHIKQARATFSDGTSQRLWRRRSTDPLRIALRPRPVRWVKLEIEQVFANPRRSSSRLCVSEVRFWGR